MNKKYSLHKIWFFYTDQNYEPTTLDDPISFYESYEEALEERRKLDVQSTRMLIYVHSGDWLEELSSFYENNYKDKQAKIVAYAKSQNWQDYITQVNYGNSTDFYWKLSVPENVTDEQVTALLNIIEASFHKIIEFKDIKEHTDVKFNKSFWEKLVLKQLESEKILEERNLYMVELEQEEYFLINQQTGYAEFINHNEAISASVDILLKALKEFPTNNFIGNTNLSEWSEAGDLLIAFLKNCTSIKFKTQSDIGRNGYYEVEFPDYASADFEEMMGLIELLRVKPFEIITRITEINGEKIDDLGPDFITF